ncbi:anoctamin-1-like isoform X2 [Agrilus planipennis]|nr:anoctamin-1-like isoform X2 [Agrilus planipennis]
MFIKVHCPTPVLLTVAQIYNCTMTFRNPHFGIRRYGIIINKPIQQITNYSSYKEIKQLAFNYGDRKPDGIVIWERSYIVYKILAKEFVKDKSYDLDDMLNKKLIKDAFPIHHGKWEWSGGGIINDRQLLDRIYSKITCSSKQPVNLIFKYYGPEVAFYFAFYNLYIKMLRIAGLAGLVCTLISIPYCYIIDSSLLNEVCNSQRIMCPLTCDIRSNCEYFKMKDRCFEAYVTVLSDNLLNVIFAMFMSIWATVFLALWRRKQSELMIRWMNFYSFNNIVYRKEYMKQTKNRRIWHYTGEWEPYTPLASLFARYGLVGVVFIAVVMLFFGTLIANMYIRLAIQNAKFERMPQTVGFLMIFVTAVISATLMIIYDVLCKKAADFMTWVERPRTKQEYDKSFITKTYVLEFVNNYLPLLYIGFIQGRIFVRPGTPTKYTIIRRMEGQACFASGCVMKLCVQLAIQLIVKSFIKLIINLVIMLFQERRRRKKLNIPVGQYEDDYTLKKMIRHHLLPGYMSIALQYGYATFFVTVFPLAPFLAYLFNLVDIKLQARKRIRYLRRPIPRRTVGIETWNEIFTAVTLLATVLNALTIAFTSDFVSKTYYRISHKNNLEGYLDSTLTEFDTNDFSMKSPSMIEEDVETCWIKARRYHYHQEDKYAYSKAHWKDVALRFSFVIVFEHLLLIFTGTLGDAIPSIPYNIKKEVAHEEHGEINRKTKLTKTQMKKNKDVYTIIKPKNTVTEVNEIV